MNHPFPPGDRTYYVSDERLRAFQKPTPEQRLRWVEELATFLRLAKIGGVKSAEIEKRSCPFNSVLDCNTSLDVS